jgi:hypothetical protein
MKMETYVKDNVTYTLTQQPYASVSGRNEMREVYKANAVDDQGDDVVLEWDIVDDCCSDESESCDWSVFRVFT